ncbi:MAG TPA: type IX secretion system membrane protein PorP/SprF [Maribacter sp.]|uniref:PorP/SprF family type IX secretion system membrane protein n=1 Tax=Maribacter TaxID=252356 RepID=UPI0007198C36|nr:MULTISPECIES: type IX secretion system membrane protein PorP/SprF [Maribacter]KSA15377.1 putative membrane protein [Maribacter dokdonensis DSW-8]HAF75850.1 type IX secretion system membrane protein PorP/SprF [Maribacter sp.]|tara:strand:- start:4529 stop:5479 length:951 start_codon:yes stop_codon:yes gene_type:complete
MKKIYQIIFLIFTMVLGGQYLMFGQQDAQYTQYMYNTFSVNPAYAGSREVLSISALHRSQWVGRDGAPNTQTLSVHGPSSDKVGLGLSIVHDEIGNNTNQNTYIDAAFSYTLKTSDNNKLSFGLKAGGHLLNLDFNNLRNFSAGGTAITDSDLYKKFTPNFGAGLYYHNDQFYAGLSIPNFLQTEHFDSADGNDNLVSVDRMTWYLISGYVFEMSSALKFKPAFLLKATSGAPLQADISANFLLNDKFSMGAAYRWDAALSALFGFQMTPEFMLGLAYDSDISELGGTKFNNGSFEVFLRYEFIKKDKIDLTPRFF